MDDGPDTGYMWGYCLLDSQHVFHVISVQDGVMRCMLPDGDFDPLPSKQVEKMEDKPEGSPIVILGNGYPCYKYTLVAGSLTQDCYLYGGPSSRMDSMVIKKLPLKSKVYNMKFSYDNDGFRLYAENMAGETLNPNGWPIAKDMKWMPRHVVELIQDHMEEAGVAHGPNVRIRLCGRNNQIISSRTPLVDPEMKKRPPGAKMRLNRKQPVQKLHLDKLMDRR